MLFSTTILFGCVNLAPNNEVPKVENLISFDNETSKDSKIIWSDYIIDNNLKSILDKAIENNYETSVAKLNIERAIESYKITGADKFPRVNLNSSLMKGESINKIESLSAEIGFNGYELDFFNKVENRRKSSIMEFESIRYDADFTRKAIVSRVLILLNTISSNNEMINKLEEIKNNASQAESIIKKKVDFGLSKEVDHLNARTITLRAIYDIEVAKNELFKNKTALDIIVGEVVDDSYIPIDTLSFSKMILRLDTEVNSIQLTDRPDIKSVEMQLWAANANIGVARANFYPSITLTTSAGVISQNLSSLSTNGSWLISPSLNIPIFNSGENKSKLKISEIDKKILIKKYEYTVQKAFKDVADSLNDMKSYDLQLKTFKTLVNESRRSVEINEILYNEGAANFLDVLNLKRDLYNIEKEYILLKKNEFESVINAYKSMSIY